MAPQSSEVDIILNRANVALAKSQRLVASWLPPRSEEELKKAKSEEELDREEQEIFKPAPESYVLDIFLQQLSQPFELMGQRIGLGAKIPENIKDGDLQRQKLSANDELRNQLLGRDHAKIQVKVKGGRDSMGGIVPSSGPLMAGSKPRPESLKHPIQEESEEEEGGRSSLGKTRKNKQAQVKLEEDTDAVGAEGLNVGQEEPAVTANTHKRSNRYLDEVLARRERNKKKKKKRSKRQKENRAQ
ncbi:MAG: hypothetical protein Q9214_003048 [Letrouitia sp. 1 TL-2023]